ncbi:S41 family peptidase [Clostridium perfringens]|uniref:S41 family peptidase n=1 Tax=Clostridium perfringens TaxID=1502 RepID=UPI0024BC9C90|nr:S41 family peptidase [Clostridium perfringens]
MENTWEKKWVEDIEYLKEELKKRHKNLFAYTEEENFNEKVENLKNIVNELDYEEMKVEISRVVSSLRDAHTSLIFPAKRFIPLNFYYFNDGVYIINTYKGYENLLFKKVLALGDMKIEEVLEELSNIISFENEYFFKAQSMKYMQIAEVLYGLLIIDTMDKVKITLDEGEYEVLTCSFEDLVYTNKRLPMYAKNDFSNLWFEVLKSGELYIKYNSCREQGEESIGKKIENIICLIEKENIEKVTVDLRNNLGGDSTLFTPLIEYLKNSEKINKKENLKAIIGRETFSSALLNAYTFKNSTNAKIIGEPSGGKPNCYGEILRLTLPNSKLVITYSTRFYKLIEDDLVMALYPEEIFLESIEDYINSI